jgi:hypothetical protein
MRNGMPSSLVPASFRHMQFGVPEADGQEHPLLAVKASSA